MASSAREIDPHREGARAAALRDVAAGAVLLALGLLTGGSSFDGRADAIDYVFDALAIAWVTWGAVRLALHAR